MKNTSEDYRKFLVLLTGNPGFSNSTAAKLLACDTAPDTFYEANKDNHFSNRQLKPGSKEQTLCYLLDVLEENNYLMEIDWKIDYESLNYAIETLSHGKLNNIVEEEDEENAESMIDLIEEASIRMKNRGYTFLIFPLDSDSYPLSLVPTMHEDALNKMIEKLF